MAQNRQQRNLSAPAVRRRRASDEKKKRRVRRRRKQKRRKKKAENQREKQSEEEALEKVTSKSVEQSEGDTKKKSGPEGTGEKKPLIL